jgi:hypothetical protein
MPNHLFAGIGKTDQTLAVPQEKLRTDFLFQSGDMLRNGGLYQAELICGPADAEAVFNHTDE